MTTTQTLVLPVHALRRFDAAVQSMNAEDAKPQRKRDSRIYHAGYAVIETFGLVAVVDPTWER